MTQGIPFGYKIRYPEGKAPEYKYNGVWIKRHKIPKVRESSKKYISTTNGFLRAMRGHMRGRDAFWKRKNIKIYGEFELDTYGKIKHHLDEQVERYGMKCPITLKDFTTLRNNETQGQQKKLFTNLSPDRLLGHTHYTIQNTLFTTVGWNISKHTWNLEEIRFLFKEEYFQRYMKIIEERFPDRKYDWKNRGLI